MGNNVRNLASGIIIIFTLSTIISKLFSHSDVVVYWLCSVPLIIISILNIYFIIKSLIKKPVDMDTRLSTFLISVFGCLGFFLVPVFMSYPPISFLNFSILKYTGAMISLIPYPFILWALICLKECFTVIPESHKIVSKGIYKYSRHPLYMCYITWIISNILMFRSVPIILISIAHIYLLFLRIKREEAILIKSFPEYINYYNETGLIGRRLNP